MNLQNLLQKMKDLDEAVMAPPSSPEVPPNITGGAGAGDECASSDLPPGEKLLIGEKGMEECGDMAPMASKQQDNVTMNISMNGSGAGGIRDLMAILRDIESSGADHDDVLVGTDEAYANEPSEEVKDVDAVTPTGLDLASKGGESPKVNGGGNPMREGLLAHLANLYQEVKSR